MDFTPGSAQPTSTGASVPDPGTGSTSYIDWLTDWLTGVGGELSSTASVSTDQADYAPGATATITASGFAAGSTITFAIADLPSSPGADGDADIYAPFTVTDGGAGDLDGLANGTVVTTWRLPTDNNGTGTGIPDALNATLVLTASGSDGQLAATSFTDAGNPVPVQVFYIPLPESQIATVFTQINASVQTPIVNYISIAALGNNTILYYDQAENGYVSDIANPTASEIYNSSTNPGGVQIWGDGNIANGAAPGVSTNAGDVINAGTVIVLSSNVTPGQGGFAFGGGDKIAVSSNVAISRAAWDSNPSIKTLIADAVEVYDTTLWGKNFTIPIGVNTPNQGGPSEPMFEQSRLSIMAGEGGAVVTIDVDGPGGAPPIVQTLTEGQAFLTGQVNQGATVTSTRNVQVSLLTGDIGSTYETRWYQILPTEEWSNAYFTPIGSRNRGAAQTNQFGANPNSTYTPSGNTGLVVTSVFLYNPNAASITVKWSTSSGAQTDVTVAAGATARVQMPQDTGAKFFTAGGEKFYALTAVDDPTGSTAGTNGQIVDWGIPLLPVDALTPQVLVGWGAGQDPTVTPQTENSSPVWITPVGNGATPVTIYVDYNGDNQGPLTDPNGFKYDVALSLSELQSATVRDPDGNQTGMLLYTLTPGVTLAAAWGQDAKLPKTVPSPALDLGTDIPPQPLFGAGKNGTLLVDADGDGKISAGDTLLYTISIPNISRAVVPSVLLKDNLPVDTTYVAGTTLIDRNDGLGFVAIPDDGTGTPFPLDDSGKILGDLNVKRTFTVSFQAKIDDFKDLTAGKTSIINTGTVSALNETRPLFKENPLNFTTDINIKKYTNGVDADTAPGPIILAGAPVTWTYNVTTTGNVWLANIKVTDNQGVTPVYQSGDVNLDGILQKGETWIYKATGTAAAGQYTNIGTATGKPVYADGTTAVPGLSNPSANDPSNYFGAVGAVVIEKQLSVDGGTTWLDADSPTGPVILAGASVKYRVAVTNNSTGGLAATVDLDDTTITGSVPVLDFKFGGAQSTSVAAGATVYSDVITTTALAGQQTDRASAVASITDGINTAPVSVAPDDANYFAVDFGPNDAGIKIVKYVNGDDANSPTGPVVAVGDSLTFTYVVTNTSNVALSNITVTDDKLGSITNFTGGDTNNNGLLDPTETWTYSKTTTAQAGQVTNIGTVTGRYEPLDQTLTDDDPANYLGQAQGFDLQITKDNGVTQVIAGQLVTYTIVVSNAGPATATGVTVKDLFPTSAPKLSDISWTSAAAGGATGNDASGTGDINDAGITMPSGSSITYTVTGTVVAPAPSTRTQDFKGTSNNPVTGPSLTINGVKADAFYDDKSTTGIFEYNVANTLWRRNSTSDHGLGVISPGESTSSTVDDNELSNQRNNDIIRLTKLDNQEQWTSVWVSSLDSGGSGSKERGTIYWSNEATPDLSKLTTKFEFQYGDFGTNVEGDLLKLTKSAALDRSAKYLFFVAGPNPQGTNNDYLVWKTSTAKVANGSLSNTASVIPDTNPPDTNPANNKATDTDILIGAPGTRLPSFWASATGQTFWDGISGNEVRPDPNTTSYPAGDLLTAPYSNSSTPGKAQDPVTGQYDTGLLLGDFNRNGITDGNEDTIFYTKAQALQILTVSPTDSGLDKRYQVAKPLVAAWLNYLAGNPVDLTSGTDARDYIEEGIDWLQALTPDQTGDKKGDGQLRNLVGNANPPGSPLSTINTSYTKTFASAAALPAAYTGNTGVDFPLLSGSTIQTNLDVYNNGTGRANGVFFGGVA